MTRLTVRKRLGYHTEHTVGMEDVVMDAKADGRRHTIEDAIIFVLRDGQIVFWREYFDTAGLSTTSLHAI